MEPWEIAVREKLEKWFSVLVERGRQCVSAEEVRWVDGQLSFVAGLIANRWPR